MPVHERHLELVFEITDCTEPTDDEARPHIGGEIHQQSGEGPDLDAGLDRRRRTDERHPLVHIEERLFGGVDRHRDHQPIDKLKAPMHHVLVPAGHRIEAARVDGDPRLGPAAIVVRFPRARTCAHDCISPSAGRSSAR